MKEGMDDFFFVSRKFNSYRFISSFYFCASECRHSFNILAV